ADLLADDPQKIDGVLDIDNMPLREEPDCIINELNLYSRKLANRQP
ncbi:SDR family oxidoreductase, partial [Klebsiella michiganensis]